MNKVQFNYKKICGVNDFVWNQGLCCYLKLEVVKEIQTGCFDILQKHSSPWELTARWTLLNFKQSIEKKVKAPYIARYYSEQ